MKFADAIARLKRAEEEARAGLAKLSPGEPGRTRAEDRVREYRAAIELLAQAALRDPSEP